jgi:hypothetical protein
MHARLMPNSIFLPLRRILYLGVLVIAGTTLSGLVPSGGASAQVLRSPTTGGEDEGPDHIFYLSFKVVFAKSEN